MEVVDIQKSILDTVGNTPLIRLSGFEKRSNFKSRIYAKLEYFNPFGSIKDRAALQIIKDAEKNTFLKSDYSIIEATSGNMGIALSAIAQIKGYRPIIVIPENMSEKRKALIKKYNAELILTSAESGMAGAIEKAKKIANEDTKIYYPKQFENYSNPLAHRLTTAPEILRQTNGRADIIIVGIGSGGTVSGIGEYFKIVSPHTQIIGVLPTEHPHKISGIGAGFVPKILNKAVLDKIITVNDEEAFEEQKHLISSDGILAGISSGAVLAACKRMISEEKIKEKNIVLIFPDSYERYM